MPSLNRASILVADDRTSGRYRLLLEAQAGEAQAGSTSITLHDLSQTGLLFEAAPGLENDAEITLDIPGIGPVVASTVWTNGTFYGAQFATPLTPDRLKAAFSESVVVWPDFGSTTRGDVDDLRAQRAALSAAVGQENASAGPQVNSSQHADFQEKLPLATRLRIIVGLSMVLWSAIAGLTWVAVA